MGGPLIKDKLFCFYAFDQYKRNFPGTAKANNPGSFFTTPDVQCACKRRHLQHCHRSDQHPRWRFRGQRHRCQQACLLAARQNAVPGFRKLRRRRHRLQPLSSSCSPATSDPCRASATRTINTPKLDWQLNPKEHVSFLYHRLRWDSPGGVQTQGTNNYAVDSFGTDFVKLDYGVAMLDSQLSPAHSPTSSATSMAAS